MNNANFSFSIKKVSLQYTPSKKNHQQQKWQEQHQQQQEQKRENLKEKKNKALSYIYRKTQKKVQRNAKRETNENETRVAHSYIKVNVKRAYT